nr:PspC domain-containing protein [Leifsonia sp. Leaf325]
MAVKQTPSEESSGSESAAPGTGSGTTDAASTAMSPTDASARTADTAAGSTAGGSSGGDSAGRIPGDEGGAGGSSGTGGSGGSSGSGSGDGDGTGGTSGAPFSGAAPFAPDTGFFGWMRSLGVPRLPGWLGGVAAGVSARLSIDPIIVRGVLVVCALFGVPVFLLYGLAWLLLPDLTGRIHLEQLLRGVFDKALVGIAILVLLGLSPFAIGGDPFYGDAWNDMQYGSFWTSSPWVYGIRFLWTIALIGAITALIIWLVRRNRTSDLASGSASTSPEAAFAQYEAEAAAGTAPAYGTPTVAAASVAPNPTQTAPVTDAAPDATEPVAPAQPASTDPGTDEYEAWKAQHAAWRVDHEAWRQSQADANRAARAQLVAENKARAAAFTARADEARRLRKLTRPRTSFAYIVATLGAGLVAGSIAAITALDGVNGAYAVTIGLAVAALVSALSMIAAGVLRRRSGFLAFVTIAALVLAIGSAAVPRTDHLLLGDNSIGLDGSTSYLIPAGTAFITADAGTAELPGTQKVDITLGAGNIYLDIYDGATVKIDAELASGSSSVWTVGADGEYTNGQELSRVTDADGDMHLVGVVGESPGIGTAPDAAITIHGLTGGIQVTVHEEDRP